MIFIHNTLTKRKDPLGIKKGGKVRLFVCGPTVYDLPHIGHAKTYIFFDAFAKYLSREKYEVEYLQNITDIDDKIIQRAKERAATPAALAREFETAYKQDMKLLGITSVTTYARATRHIKEIISQVQHLLDKGYAYEIPGDGVYYDISKFADYGKLAGRTVQQAEDGVSRIDDSDKKKNKGDFALWKFSKQGEPEWKSPWGKGRPGWHIEDTAITEKYFGAQYDIHGGGGDLVFPHHEAEIAQMEAISGKKPLARIWMHTGFLTVHGDKMSKSLGNFVTVRSFLDHYSPRLLRFFVLKNHYRSPMDFTEDLLAQARQALSRLDEFTDKLARVPASAKAKSTGILKSTQKSLDAALAEDFNTALAVAILFELSSFMNPLLAQGKVSKKEADATLRFLKDMDSFLGFLFWGRSKERVPAAVLKLATEREIARATKDWQKADDIRKEIEHTGWIVEDTQSGMRLKKQ